MDTLYLILYVVAVVCFAIAFFVPVYAIRLLCIGLLSWVTVDLVIQVDSMVD